MNQRERSYRVCVLAAGLRHMQFPFGGVAHRFAGALALLEDFEAASGTGVAHDADGALQPELELKVRAAWRLMIEAGVRLERVSPDLLRAGADLWGMP